MTTTLESTSTTNAARPATFMQQGLAAALGSSTIRQECVFAREPTLQGVVFENFW